MINLTLQVFLQYIKSEMIGHMFNISRQCIMSTKLYSFTIWTRKANVVDIIHVRINCELYELYCDHM